MYHNEQTDKRYKYCNCKHKWVNIMAERAKYCKCLNTYTIDKCDKKRCKESEYWKQGIGDIGGKAPKE